MKFPENGNGFIKSNFELESSKINKSIFDFLISKNFFNYKFLFIIISIFIFLKVKNKLISKIIEKAKLIY